VAVEVGLAVRLAVEDPLGVSEADTPRVTLAVAEAE
jgi:hypothetical protein